MRSFGVLAVIAVSLLPVSAMADSTQPAAPATTASATANPDEIVCRAGQPTTGTRIPGSRQCFTNRQWDEMRKQAQEDLNKSIATGLQTSGGEH